MCAQGVGGGVTERAGGGRLLTGFVCVLCPWMGSRVCWLRKLVCVLVCVRSVLWLEDMFSSLCFGRTLERSLQPSLQEINVSVFRVPPRPRVFCCAAVLL